MNIEKICDYCFLPTRQENLTKHRSRRTNKCKSCQSLTRKRDYRVRKYPCYSYFFRYEFSCAKLKQLESVVPIPRMERDRAGSIFCTRQEINNILRSHKIIKINEDDQSLGGLLSVLTDLGEVEYLRGSKQIITLPYKTHAEIKGLSEEKYQSVKEKYERGEYFSWPDTDIFDYKTTKQITTKSTGHNKSTFAQRKNRREKYTRKEFRESNTYKHAGERQCYEILSNGFGVPFTKVRPFWLRNPITERPLEIDFYNEEYKLGFEYQEANHEYKDNVRYRDEIKVKICKALGIHLYHIPDTADENKLNQIIAEIIGDTSFDRSGMTRKSRRKSI